MNPDSPIPGSSCRGALLVATPPLDDPNFDRAVVYVLEHNELGAVGVVLNRPSGLSLPESLSGWNDRLSAPSLLFEGGPVELDALIAVGRLCGTLEGVSNPVEGDIATVDLSTDPAEVASVVLTLRVFRGYSGWSPFQLDAELAEHAWIVLAAADDDIFTDDPDGLWRRVLRRQGGRLSWIADAPDDLSNN